MQARARPRAGLCIRSLRARRRVPEAEAICGRCHRGGDGLGARSRSAQSRSRRARAGGGRPHRRSAQDPGDARGAFQEAIRIVLRSGHAARGPRPHRRSEGAARESRARDAARPVSTIDEERMEKALMQHIADFILELDKLKTVTRKIRVRGVDRYENPAEHSWQLALLATSLVPFADGAIDINRVISMLLVHDVGEIDTGDTSAFVEEGLADRKAGERAAVTRIFGMLPEAQRDHLMSLWLELEEEHTPESRFAHSGAR